MPQLDDSSRFICLIPSQLSASTLGQLIAWPIDVAIDGESVWLHFSAQNDRLLELQQMLPGQRFRLVHDRWLVQDGQQVAKAQLPELSWQPLRSLVNWQLPTALFAGAVDDSARATIGLIRGGIPRDPTAAICKLRDLARWIDTAPAARFNNISFCVSGDECLLVGTPLPPIACRFLCEYEGVFIPAGRTWTPNIPAGSVRKIFALQRDEMLVWLESEEWSGVDSRLLGPLGRASVRELIRLEKD